MHTRRTLKSVLIWSIISAAFIGPGTVTTAVSAGSLFQLNLLWAVVFATVACIALQEVAARITIATGLNFGQALVQRFGIQRGRYLRWFIGGSVIGGCAAYEAGNIVGAVAGIQLMSGLGVPLLAFAITLLSAVVLWKNNPAWISTLMTLLVALMGVAFFALAVTRPVHAADVFRSAVIPSIPLGSEMTILGLIGTTVVPYNIFLGSGISKGQTVSLMRIGLSLSVVIGGLITAAILIAGTLTTNFISFQGLHADIEARLGWIGALAFTLGLFGAGFSSAITSPYAASMIVKTVFEERRESVARTVWAAVLFIGFVVGASGLKPVPVILLVQALNGLLLPFLTIFLMIVANDPKIMPPSFRTGVVYNLLLLAMLFGITMISLNNIDKTLTTTLGLPAGMHLTFVIVIASLITLVTAVSIFRTGSLDNR